MVRRRKIGAELVRSSHPKSKKLLIIKEFLNSMKLGLVVSIYILTPHPGHFIDGLFILLSPTAYCGRGKPLSQQ